MPKILLSAHPFNNQCQYLTIYIHDSPYNSVSKEDCIIDSIDYNTKLYETFQNVDENYLKAPIKVAANYSCCRLENPFSVPIRKMGLFITHRLFLLSMSQQVYT